MSLETKICGNCKIEKSILQFSRKGPRLRSSQCKSCRAVYWQKHYKKNSKKYQAAARRWDAKNVSVFRAFISWLKDQPCWDCGRRFLECAMDFDHVRGPKKFDISVKRCNGRVSSDTLWAEVLKCELICANCHRVRTSQRRLDIGAASVV